MIQKLSEMVRACSEIKSISELKAYNRQLLNDKDASPAIIAGYRARGEELIGEIAERNETIHQLQIQAGAQELRIRALRQEYKVCDMCNYLERDVCLLEKEEKDAEITRLREGIQAIADHHVKVGGSFSETSTIYLMANQLLQPATATESPEPGPGPTAT